MDAQDEHYDRNFIDFLEWMWGEGYLSPGGADEVARVVEGLDLTGLRAIDIGCGSGAIAVALVENHGAGHVTGIDVEETACADARARAEAAGLEDRIAIRHVEPGPLPFPDASLDLVFSKDAIIHIPDKEALAREIFRVLRPGGWLAASDWLISHDGDPSPEMAHYIECEGLDFAMASPRRYQRALEDAGFEQVRLTNRNPWYRTVAREELATLEGPRRGELERTYGRDFIAEQVATWTAMVKVLDTGEHCPHHLRARKPE